MTHDHAHADTAVREFEKKFKDKSGVLVYADASGLSAAI
jgi:hypothetical protein